VSIDIMMILAVIAAAVCIVWAYPRLPGIGQLILAVVVAIVGVVILLSLTGVVSFK
jgi:hypothetical protein